MEAIRDLQRQGQGQLPHPDLRRQLRQVSVNFPLLGQLGSSPISSIPSRSAAQGLVPVVAPLLTQLARSPPTPGVRGTSDRHTLSTAAPSSSTGLEVDANSVARAPSSSPQDAASSISSSASTPAPETAPVLSPAANAPTPADLAASSSALPAASPSASGAADAQARTSPSLLSLLPDIMQVLNSENQAGQSGRSLNLTVSAGAMSPDASAADAPVVTGTLANVTVDSSPKTVDVQVNRFAGPLYSYVMQCIFQDAYVPVNKS